MTRPSSNEDEYFARQEIEKRKRLALEIQSCYKEEEQQRLKDLHNMHCPRCGLELQSVVFKGYIMEKCFSCSAMVMSQDDLERLVGEGETVASSLFGLFK
jgi:hypothetical protein